VIVEVLNIVWRIRSLGRDTKSSKCCRRRRFDSIKYDILNSLTYSSVRTRNEERGKGENVPSEDFWID